MRTRGKGTKHKIKPFKFPEGMQIVVDTREQDGLFQGRLPKGLIIVSDTLHKGDYSIRGFEEDIAFERKQMSDFYSYIGKERKKTIKKVRELSQCHHASLVIEASEDEIFNGNMFSQVSPEVARQFLVSCRLRWNIHVFMSSSKKACQRYIIDHCIKFYKIKRGIE